jgi:hypothetical protein
MLLIWGMRKRRNTEEIEQLLKEFESSGRRRSDFCREAGMALSTLGRYLKRQRGSGQGLVRVRLQPAPEQAAGFALVLGNGRRIESGWGFGEAELARLIRIAEAV